MIDIIGNIKVDESNTTRINYLKASLQSFNSLDANIVIHMEGASTSLIQQIRPYAGKNALLLNNISGDYGEVYRQLMGTYAKNDYVLNFMEDHFLMASQEDVFEIICEMQNHDIDLCKATFYDIEINSVLAIDKKHKDFYTISWDNDMENFHLYQKYYGIRYYIGVNAIMSREFAWRIWNSSKGASPHHYEQKEFNPQFFHKACIPVVELLCSIDDDHGEARTCLLNRNEEKFNRIWNEILGVNAG
jgi:hypothetical protein